MPTPSPELSRESQERLRELALASIRHGLTHARPLKVDLDALAPDLRQERATFVTLERHGALRGCIGTLEARRPLAQDIADHAFAAAFRDARFPPLRAEELNGLELHLSLLTMPEPIPVHTEAELIASLVPGLDGLILEEGHRRATFLPSVWESLPDPQDFVRHLKRKGGWPDRYWSPEIKAHRYRAESI